MFNHAPPSYACPFCSVIGGVDRDDVLTRQADVVARSEAVIAFVASHWRPANRGHVIVSPTRHIENLYDLPDDLGAAVFAMSRRIAIALKRAYTCDGVSTRQHNEPAGYQDVWHYHLHVFPRYDGDRLYASDEPSIVSQPAERVPYADRLRAALLTDAS